MSFPEKYDPGYLICKRINVRLPNGEIEKIDVKRLIKAMKTFEELNIRFD